jgi:hypothetical protein
MNLADFWHQAKFPVTILASFLVIALWVLAGRLVFGVFGWMVLILLFTMVPAIVMYGIVLTVIVAIRQRTYRYRKWGPFMTSVVITLVALFMVGAFIPDGGDSNDSASSALSVLLGDRTNNGLIAISGAIAGWSIFVSAVASIVAFVFAFAERSKKTAKTSAVVGLKESK